MVTWEIRIIAYAYRLSLGIESLTFKVSLLINLIIHLLLKISLWSAKFTWLLIYFLTTDVLLIQDCFVLQISKSNTFNSN